MKVSSLLLMIKLWQHMRLKRRIQVCLLSILMIASGLTELLSISAAFPFLSALSNKEAFWESGYSNSFKSFFIIDSADKLIIVATLFFIAAITLAMILKLTNLWFGVRLAAKIGTDLSCEALSRTLYQPYESILKRNSSQVIATCSTHISRTVAAINAVLQIVASTIVSTSILLGLLIINKSIALLSMAVIASAYFVVGWYTKKRLNENGSRVAKSCQLQIQTLQETFASIRDILLDSSQPVFLRSFAEADSPQRLYQAKNLFLGAFPKYIIEVIGLVTICFLGASSALNQNDQSALISVLGTFALGAQRLIPSMQAIYGGWASVNSYKSSILEVLDMLNQHYPNTSESKDIIESNSFHSIRLEGVSFSFDKKKDVVSDLHLTIQRGQRVGFIGTTGSGKSTTVDLIMGLLTPTNGRFLVDNVNINDSSNIASWRSKIAHVPQNIFLADTTFASNIAFGVDKDLIDMERVRLAARKAHIEDFIDSTFNGFESTVGERGASLSGGQRQRIAIARALYKNAEILILDEATSALDAETEAAVMKELSQISEDTTLIIIAHRLSTLSICDIVYSLRGGRIIDSSHPSEIY